MACADSSAGMMPSVRERSFAASSAAWIVHRGIFGAMLVGEPGVLRADGRIVEAGGNGMRRGNLAVFILQDVGVGALKNAGARAGESLMRGEARRVFTQSIAAAAGFDADHFHVGIFQEIIEQSDGIGAAANAGDKDAWANAFRRPESVGVPRGR